MAHFHLHNQENEHSLSFSCLSSRHKSVISISNAWDDDNMLCMYMLIYRSVIKKISVFSNATYKLDGFADILRNRWECGFKICEFYIFFVITIGGCLYVVVLGLIDYGNSYMHVLIYLLFLFSTWYGIEGTPKGCPPWRLLILIHC